MSNFRMSNFVMSNLSDRQTLLCQTLLCQTIECYQAPDQLDSEGWSPLHHACDATSYSWRASRAAFALLRITPPDILNMATTGTQPPANSCLHLASAGSDKGFARAELVQALLEHKADLEQRESNGNTAYLLAAAQGATDVMEMLVQHGANIFAKSKKNAGGYQFAASCSGSSKRAAEHHGAPKTWTTSAPKAARKHHGSSESRQGRHMQQHATNQTAMQTQWHGQQWSGWRW